MKMKKWNICAFTIEMLCYIFLNNLENSIKNYKVEHNGEESEEQIPILHIIIIQQRLVAQPLTSFEISKTEKQKISFSFLRIA